MSKLIIIGIDGLDRKYVEEHIDELSNFKKIMNKSPKIISESVFPPDSDTAWATIYTGLNPAKHGVVDFVDPLERKKLNKKEWEYSYVDAFKDKTFWDILGRNGKKVCVIYPHMAVPVWKVNGLMISPDPETSTFQYYPPDYNFGFDLSNLQVLRRIPRTKLEFETYLNKKRAIVENEFDFATKMHKREDWDLLFLYSSALDTSMHIFWNYCAKDDPTYPGRNPFENAIIDFHKLYDQLIGDFLKNVSKDITVLFISDHGHFRRPINLLNVNEVLKRNGFLVAKEGSKGKVLSLKEKFKRLVVDIAQKSGMRPAAQTILRIFPRIKNMYTKPSIINFDKTLAHCTDLSGMKAYSYGGIKVYKEKFKSDEYYNAAIDKIISELLKIEKPNSNVKVFEWVKKREEVYSGPYIEKYPEILFNLVEHYGAGWNINGDIWDKSFAHKFFPGSHRGATPILYLTNYNGSIKRENMQLEDICPTILKFFDISVQDYEFDGASLI